MHSFEVLRRYSEARRYQLEREADRRRLLRQACHQQPHNTFPLTSLGMIAPALADATLQALAEQGPAQVLAVLVSSLVLTALMKGLEWTRLDSRGG